jgi:hypothetical protein
MTAIEIIRQDGWPGGWRSKLKLSYITFCGIWSLFFIYMFPHLIVQIIAHPGNANLGSLSQYLGVILSSKLSSLFQLISGSQS